MAQQTPDPNPPADHACTIPLAQLGVHGYARPRCSCGWRVVDVADPAPALAATAADLLPTLARPELVRTPAAHRGALRPAPPTPAPKPAPACELLGGGTW